jgi:hypothetical protein
VVFILSFAIGARTPENETFLPMLFYNNVSKTATTFE